MPSAFKLPIYCFHINSFTNCTLMLNIILNVFSAMSNFCHLPSYRQYIIFIRKSIWITYTYYTFLQLYFLRFRNFAICIHIINILFSTWIFDKLIPILNISPNVFSVISHFCHLHSYHQYVVFKWKCSQTTSQTVHYSKCIFCDFGFLPHAFISSKYCFQTEIIIMTTTLLHDGHF